MSDVVLVPPANLRGATLKNWATKHGIDFAQAKELQKLASEADEDVATVLTTDEAHALDAAFKANVTYVPPAADAKPAPEVDPKEDLKRDYVFIVDSRSPQAGRDLDLKIVGTNGPWVSHLNNGSKYIKFRGYRFATRSKGIRDFLRAGIADGTFNFIKEDVQVTVRCAVPNCTFVSSQRGSLGQQELTAHFMANHAGTGDEDGED